jgi:hypothetical protein
MATSDSKESNPRLWPGKVTYNRPAGDATHQRLGGVHPNVNMLDVKRVEFIRSSFDRGVR